MATARARPAMIQIAIFEDVTCEGRLGGFGFIASQYHPAYSLGRIRTEPEIENEEHDDDEKYGSQPCDPDPARDGVDRPLGRLIRNLPVWSELLRAAPVVIDFLDQFT